MGLCLDKLLLGAAGAGLAVGIEKLAELIKKTVNTARKPASNLPPFYTTLEGMMRPGLSAISVTANQIARLGEAGANTGVLPDGSEPIAMKMIRIQNEEMIKEIQLNMKTVVEIPPGTPLGVAGPYPVVSGPPMPFSGLSY